jgi:hypothetical protein
VGEKYTSWSSLLWSFLHTPDVTWRHMYVYCDITADIS